MLYFQAHNANVTGDFAKFRDQKNFERAVTIQKEIFGGWSLSEEIAKGTQMLAKKAYSVETDYYWKFFDASTKRLLGYSSHDEISIIKTVTVI